MLKGTDILYMKKTQIAVNEFHEPVYDVTFATIHNVLVAPVESLANSEIPEVDNLTRRKEVITLAIPKGDDHDWEDCEIVWNNTKYRTVGKPVRGQEEMIPLDWHLKVKAQSCE